MAIEDRVERVKVLLDRIRVYNTLVHQNDFKPDTVGDMKGNAKEMCDEAKSEVDQIKVEVGQWV